MANICPICQKDDQIKRLEVKYRDGISSGQFSGPTVSTSYSDGKIKPSYGRTTLTGSTSTNLSTLLAPPPSPPEPKGFGCWWILLIYPVIPLLGGIFSIPFAIPGMVLFGISSAIWPDKTTPLSVIGAVLVIIAFCIGYFIAIRFVIKQDRKKKASMEKTLAEEKPKWEQAMQRWFRSYYCERDGIVYDPIVGDSCVPALVKEFVYKQP